MLAIRSFVACAVLIVTAGSAMAADTKNKNSADTKNPAEDKVAKLIGVLQSSEAPANKAIACKQLAIYGTKDAVPALAALLPDEQLASWARIALEAIPDPAAEEALRQAMGKLQGRLLIGVINSLGVRRDAKATDALVGRLKDADAEVASAAAAALGRLGGASIAKILEQSLAGAPAAVRSAVAEGCILCAERFLAEGNADEAVKLYDTVRKGDVPKTRICEATRGAILARQSAGVPLLVEQLRSADKDLFAIGLRTARELPGREATAALVAELGQATPDRQALLILALADRGDAAGLPAVLQAAKSGPEKARIAAIRVLPRLGDASCVPALLDAAKAGEAELSQTALAVLADLPGKEVDDDVAARLGKAQGKDRQVLIQLAGQRHIEAATPELLKAAEDADGQVRAAALVALGSTIAIGDLPVLIARVANPRQPEETKAAEEALSAACTRMPDREACAERLVAAMAQCPAPAKRRFLGVLSAVGGAKALQTVGAAAKDADPETQDAASRLLGEWMNADAGPVLLDLVKTAADKKYKIRALRGYIRLVRQFSMPEPQRAEMCRTALEIADRDAEKKLVLEVLERYPSIDMLKLAVEPSSKAPSLKDDATAISLLIAEKIGGQSGDIQKLLAEIHHEPVKVEILKAEYGAGTTVKDVTDVLRKHARDFPLIVLPAPSYNSSFGGDPASGVVKQLKVQYRINGKAGEVALPENATIMLPIPK